MNTLSKIDAETFFRFAAEHPEQRYELEKGRIVQQMTGGTWRHSKISRRIEQLLEQQLDPATWLVVTERGVAVGESGRFADVVVEPIPGPNDDLRTARPALIVEVLSPSSMVRDLNIKLAEYLAIASLDVYIVASQSEPALLVWQRQSDGKFPSEPAAIDKLDQNADIVGRQFKATLALADIYRGLVSVAEEQDR